MKLNKILFFSTILMIGLASCGDDNEAPSVTINQPANGSTYATSDTIVFNVTVTDDVEVSTVSLQSASNTLTLNENVNLSSYNDKSNFTFGYGIILNPDLSAGDYQIDVIATDEEGEEGSDRLDFTIQ